MRNWALQHFKKDSIFLIWCLLNETISPIKLLCGLRCCKVSFSGSRHTLVSVLKLLRRLITIHLTSFIYTSTHMNLVLILMSTILLNSSCFHQQNVALRTHSEITHFISCIFRFIQQLFWTNLLSKAFCCSLGLITWPLGRVFPILSHQ